MIQFPLITYLWGVFEDFVSIFISSNFSVGLGAHSFPFANRLQLFQAIHFSLFFLTQVLLTMKSTLTNSILIQTVHLSDSPFISCYEHR